MSFAGRRMKRGRAGTRIHCGNAMRTLFRLLPSFQLTPCWEGRCADPEEKQGPATDIGYQWPKKLEGA